MNADRSTRRPDVSSDPSTPERAELEALTSRLDSWGRGTIAPQPTEPDESLLHAVRRRGVFVQARRWTLRSLVAAACVVLCVVFVTRISRPRGLSSLPDSPTVAWHSRTSVPDTTIGSIMAINRGLSADQLRLPSTDAGTPETTELTSTRVSDIWRPDAVARITGRD